MGKRSLDEQERYDFHVTHDESIAPVEYNYRSKTEHEAAGTGYYVEGDQPSSRASERTRRCTPAGRHRC